MPRPKNFAKETGFYIGASLKIGQMILFKDINKEQKTASY
jgi:hypothetical protein